MKLHGKVLFGWLLVQANLTSKHSLEPGVNTLSSITLSTPVAVTIKPSLSSQSAPPPLEDAGKKEYKIYKRRWVGIVALVLLNIVKGMNWVWFGAIANTFSKEFDISLSQVNWLGNVPHISYLLFSWCVPMLIKRLGLRYLAMLGSIVLITSAWLRYAATTNTLTTKGSYTLLITAQLLVGIVAPCFQVIGPRYAEVWFDLDGRTTATMIVAISDPLGTAAGQIISPFFLTTPTKSAISFGILILAIITSAVTPLSYVVLPKPPCPPTYSGSLTSPPLIQTVRAMLNMTRPGEQFLSHTERLDFVLLFVIFGVLVAGTSSFSVFISQIFTPYGYSNVTCGLLGGIFLIAGLLSAIISAPLFDRVLIYRLASSVKFALPVLAIAWVGLIFAVRPDDLIPVYVVLISISSICFILLPVGLELGVEITHSAETSTAVLWSGGNFISFVWVIAMDRLRAREGASPPFNMQRALVFNTTFICATAIAVFFFTGNQTRRKLDLEMQANVDGQITA